MTLSGLRLFFEKSSIYCEETGGDYFDFITSTDWGSKKVAIAVGDVAGHGISAALFMATVRAFLRSRVMQPGSLAEVVRDVNRLFCIDSAPSGDFMSLFLMFADASTHKIQWVRASHPPALVYDRATDCFEELRGNGAVLGMDEDSTFEEYEYGVWDEPKVLFIGTDGIRETENPWGEAFGMDRLKSLLREHSRDRAKEIIEAITHALRSFRQTAPQEDDVTLIVMKAA